MKTAAIAAVSCLLYGMCTAPPARAIPGCWNGKRGQTRLLNGFLLEVLPVKTLKASPNVAGCRAAVKSPQGREIFSAEDYAMEINSATGEDIGNDGQPDVVFAGYSGGAHCCSTYWIVSLGKTPRLARKICNSHAITFEDIRHDGRIEMKTVDGRFDLFDGSCFACSPMPLVFLRLEGQTLRRVDSDFWPLYEKEIAAATARLSAGKIERFRKVTSAQVAPFGDATANLYWGNLETKEDVLTIVVAYLYAGREEEAWRNLSELWPPADIPRIRALILKAAHSGFLGDPKDPGFGCSR